MSFFACQQNEYKDSKDQNPHADGFNIENSDTKAIAIADMVMEAMGGRQNWDNTRYLRWNFFGSRLHTWDKKTGEIQIKGIKKDFNINMNIHSMKGNVFVGEQELSKKDSLDLWLGRGKSWWINDSYWLIMPFKLKDSGVTLKYLGRDTMKGGIETDVIALTFEDVGDTPQNKYHVFIDTVDLLVKQWDYYSNATDSLPRLSTPWEDYNQFNRIKLSGDRGRFALTEISASDTLSVFFK